SRNAYSIVITRHRCKVAHDQNSIAVVHRFSQEAEHALFGVASINPLKPGTIAIQFMECALIAIRVIQIRNPPQSLLMRGKIEEGPVEVASVAPLPPLPELTTHKEKFLAGLRIHIGVKKPEIREFLPEIAGHARQQ